MRTILIATGALLAALPAAGLAQAPAPAASAGCYIEVQRLMAEAPAGIGELGAAIRALDAALRPQVEEIVRLKQQVARLEDRQVQTVPVSIDAALAEDADPSQAAAPIDERTVEELRAAHAELEAKQAQLKLDYRTRQQALVGPVQARVSQRAQAFAAERGCAGMKMARASDLEALRTAAAQDVTGEFVTWYLARPPA